MDELKPGVYERFWQKVEKTDSCWIWVGSNNGRGYGEYVIEGRKFYAHRLSYVFAGKEIPEGYSIDHLCRNPPCINPDHLEAVTHAENVRRGVSGLRRREEAAKITHCPAGHEYDEANTRISSSGSRVCRACRREWARNVGSPRRTALRAAKRAEIARAAAMRRHPAGGRQ